MKSKHQRVLVNNGTIDDYEASSSKSMSVNKFPVSSYIRKTLSLNNNNNNNSAVTPIQSPNQSLNSSNTSYSNHVNGLITSSQHSNERRSSKYTATHIPLRPKLGSVGENECDILPLTLSNDLLSLTTGGDSSRESHQDSIRVSSSKGERSSSHHGRNMRETMENAQLTIAMSKVGKLREKMFESDDHRSLLKHYEIKYSDLTFELKHNGIRKMIGQGGFGAVYIASFRGTDCAVKEVLPERINDDLLKRFKAEFVMLASIRHPNIIQLLGGTFDLMLGEMCIVTEFCECGNLGDFLAHRGATISWGIIAPVEIVNNEKSSTSQSSSTGSVVSMMKRRGTNLFARFDFDLAEKKNSSSPSSTKNSKPIKDGNTSLNGNSGDANINPPQADLLSVVSNAARPIDEYVVNDAATSSPKGKRRRDSLKTLTQRKTTPDTVQKSPDNNAINSTNSQDDSSSGGTAGNNSIADYCDGTTFDLFVTKLDWAIELAKAMCYLHDSNVQIIHRDLKSSNMLLTDSLAVKLADFGECRFLEDGGATLTQIGTPYFIAPEIFECHGKYGSSADVYSYGIVLLEIFYNGDIRKGVFNNFSGPVIMHKVLNKWRPKITEIDSTLPQLASVVRKCWAHNPKERPTFRQILNLLISFSDGVLDRVTMERKK